MCEYVLKLKNKLKFIESIKLDNRNGFKFDITNKDVFALTFTNINEAYAAMMLYNAFVERRYINNVAVVATRQFKLGTYRFVELT